MIYFNASNFERNYLSLQNAFIQCMGCFPLFLTYAHGRIYVHREQNMCVYIDTRGWENDNTPRIYEDTWMNKDQKN